MTEVCGISERRDTEKLLFLSRLVQRGDSQTRQGGLERWMYTLAVSVLLAFLAPGLQAPPNV